MNLHSTEHGGGEGTTVSIQTLYENQQTSFSSFVSDSCANSFVFLFGRRKGGSQEQTPSFKLEAEGLYKYSFNKFRILVQILQPKTAGVSVIGKHLPSSYTARKNRLNTNVRLVSILQAILEDR